MHVWPAPLQLSTPPRECPQRVASQGSTVHRAPPSRDCALRAGRRSGVGERRERQERRSQMLPRQRPHPQLHIILHPPLVSPPPHTSYAAPWLSHATRQSVSIRSSSWIRKRSMEFDT